MRKLSVYEGVYFVDNGGEVVLRNIAGQALGTGKYMTVELFVTGNTVVRIRSALGTWVVAYLDTTGRELVRFDVRKWLAIAGLPGKTDGPFFMDLNEFFPFSEGLTPIRSMTSRKSGFVNLSLQLVIPVSFTAWSSRRTLRMPSISIKDLRWRGRG
jgi:hypothetical protein